MGVSPGLSDGQPAFRDGEPTLCGERNGDRRFFLSSQGNEECTFVLCDERNVMASLFLSWRYFQGIG